MSFRVQDLSKGTGYNRKRSGILLVGTQSGQLVKALNHKCSCREPHYQLHGAELKRAERYCVGFCRAVARGFTRELSLLDALGKDWLESQIAISEAETLEVQFENFHTDRCPPEQLQQFDELFADLSSLNLNYENYYVLGEFVGKVPISNDVSTDGRRRLLSKGLGPIALEERQAVERAHNNYAGRI